MKENHVLRAALWALVLGVGGLACSETDGTEAGSQPENAQASSSAAVLISGLARPDSLKVSGNEVFVTDPGSGRVLSVPAQGGAVKVLAEGQRNPGPVTASGSFVFWVDRDTKEILSVPRR